MAEPSLDPLEMILRQCEAAAPEPWYPKLHAESSGVPRDSLDAPLEKLRLANLIRLTDWVKGRGQGYVLTPEGTHALKNGRELTRVREGRAATPKPAAEITPQRKGRWSAWDRGEAIREIFMDPPAPVVSRAILFAYIGVFLVGMFLAQQRNLPVNLYLAGSPTDPDMRQKYSSILSTLGSVNGLEIIEGQWWRLMTACFVHIGIIHLALNSWCLYGTGRYIEPMWGRGRYIILYVLSGIGGSCVALMTNIGGIAGGSGALFGIFASEVVWFLLNRSLLPSQLVSAWQRNIGTNILLMVFISLVPGVSWGGHLGGAIVGAVVAVLLHYQRFGLGIVRWLALAALPLVPVASIGALVHTMNTNSHWVQLREAARETQTFEERKQLRERYKREVLDAEEEARSAYNRAYNAVLHLHPERRDSAKKEQAIKDLSKAQGDVDRALRLIGAPPPMKDARIEEDRQEIIEYLGLLGQSCALAETYLRDNHNLLNANKEALDQLDRKIKEMQKRLAVYLR